MFELSIYQMQNVHMEKKILFWVLLESVTINGVILEGGYLYVM